MVTPAKVSIETSKNAILRKDGKTMRLTVLTDQEIQLKTYSTKPKADYDASNGNTRLIGFEVSLPSGQAARTAVLLTPSSANAKSKINLPPLLQWSPPR